MTSSLRSEALRRVVNSNDATRIVAGLLRRPSTDHRGAPWTLTRADADRMLDALNRSRRELDVAAQLVQGLRDEIPS